MLYQLHELQRAFLGPVADYSAATAKLLTNTYSPWSMSPVLTEAARRMAAGYELMYRLGKEYEKPQWDLPTTQIDGKTVPVVAVPVIEKPFCKLIHFQRYLPATDGAYELRGSRAAAAPSRKPTAKTAASSSAKPARRVSDRHDPKVLIFAPLSGHHATLLRDTVRALLPDHEVYITDWVDARMVPMSAGDFNLDDYVHYCIEFIQALGPDVHCISVCQPTVPVLGAISLMASNKDAALPKTMTMMGGPIDTRRNPTQVNNLATTKSHQWFESNVICTVPDKYAGAGRRVYPGFLQHGGFVAMNPDRHLNSHWDFYMDLCKGDLEDADSHRKFYDEYNAVLDLPAQYYLQTIDVVFQRHALPNGTWTVRDKPVRPQDIKSVALFTIEGELDDISGSGQTQAAQGLCSNIPARNKQHFTAPQCGHYGIFSGRRWREIIAPKIKEFIRAHA